MKWAQQRHREQVMKNLQDKMESRKRAKARLLASQSTGPARELPRLASTLENPIMKEVDLLSDGSDDSRQSNGYNNKNPKAGRCYKDGYKTFYSGRLYSTANMAQTQSNFLSKWSN